MEQKSSFQGDRNFSNFEAKENDPENIKVVEESDGKKTKGALRFSLSTENKNDENYESEGKLTENKKDENCVSEEKAKTEVVEESDRKKTKGALRFSLSTERRYDEKSISEEELKKKRERLMHRRGTQYEYLVDGLAEKTKDSVKEKSKLATDVLPKDKTAILNNKLPEAENSNWKENPKQTEKFEKEQGTSKRKVEAGAVNE